MKKIVYLLLFVFLLSGCNSINDNKSADVKTSIKTNNALSCKEEILKNAYHPVFSLDWKHFVYIVKENWKDFVVKNWKKWKKYDNINEFDYSLDWKYFVYTVEEKWEDILVKETCWKYSI